MNTRRDSAVALATGLVDGLPDGTDVEVGVCPPAVYLNDVGACVSDSPVGLGAQNMHSEDDGAFTGEVNVGMLGDVGCKYVILGHSERRQFFGETNEGVSKKMHIALGAGVVPIVCVGETLEEREANRTEAVVTEQIEGSLAGLEASQLPTVVIAYEPVWAIGTGKVATPEQAEAVHMHIRKLLTDQFGSEAAEQVRIQYGGSVKPGNAAELLSQPNIDGALVGGASLKAEDFLGIINAV